MSDDETTLSSADVEAIARRVVALLPAPTHRWMSPSELAEDLGIGVKLVRAHAIELGGVRMGDGPKPRWFYDPIEARRRLEAMQAPAPERLRSKRRPVQTVPAMAPRLGRRGQA